MEENGTAPAAETVETPQAEETAVETPAATEAAPEAAEPEEISYHAVEKEGHVAAIWEMQGKKHLRTIDPRSSEGKQIMDLYTADAHE